MSSFTSEYKINHRHDTITDDDVTDDDVTDDDVTDSKDYSSDNSDGDNSDAENISLDKRGEIYIATNNISKKSYIGQAVSQYSNGKSNGIKNR